MILLSTLLFTLNVASANENGPKGEDAPADNMSNRDVDIDKIHYKPGKGLVVASWDGDFKMFSRLRAQFRFAVLLRSSFEVLVLFFLFERGEY